MKIDTEVAGLKTMLESHKLDTIKYLAGRTAPVHCCYEESVRQKCFRVDVVGIFR